MALPEEIQSILLEFGDYEVSHTDRTTNAMAEEILRLRKELEVGA